MTDPHALLDAYEYDNAANDDHAPKAFAALRSVLDLHILRYGKGRCMADDMTWPCATVKRITKALASDEEPKP